MAQVLQLQPFDTSTAEGRSKERYRRAAWTMAANLFSTGLNMVTLLVAIPLTLPYLGAARFGIWMTIASLVGLLSFLDLGVGNGLINKVSRTQVERDADGRLVSIVSRGMLLLTAIAVAVWLGSWLLVNLLPLPTLFKGSTPAQLEEARSALVAFAALFAAAIPFGGAGKVFVGLQRGWIPHGVKAAGSLTSLFALYAVSQRQMGIVALLLATYGVQVLFQAILPLWLAHGGLVARRGVMSGPLAASDFRSLASSGGLFLALQVGTMIGWGGDSLIVASVMGPSAVATLAVAQRLFQFVTVPLAILNAPLWSAYADAHARRDTAFIRLTLARSMATTVVAAVALGTAVILSASTLVPLWVGHSISLSMSFLAVYAAWSVVDAAGNAFGMFMNGVNEIQIELIVVALFCPLALPLKWYLTEFHGLTGLLVGTLVAYVATIPLLYATLFRRPISRHWQHERSFRRF